MPDVHRQPGRQHAAGVAPRSALWTASPRLTVRLLHPRRDGLSGERWQSGRGSDLLLTIGDRTVPETLIHRMNSQNSSPRNPRSAPASGSFAPRLPPKRTPPRQSQTKRLNIAHSFDFINLQPNQLFLYRKSAEPGGPGVPAQNVAIVRKARRERGAGQRVHVLIAGRHSRPGALLCCAVPAGPFPWPADVCGCGL